MNRPVFLRVAVNAPLSRLFDYLPPEGPDAGDLRPGMRLLVPFGRRQEVAMLIELADRTEVPAAKLRRALRRLDSEPLLNASELWLLCFTSDYYHHPIGEVVSAALPAPLRQGRVLYPVSQRLALTDVR